MPPQRSLSRRVVLVFLTGYLLAAPSFAQTILSRFVDPPRTWRNGLTVANGNLYATFAEGGSSHSGGVFSIDSQFGYRAYELDPSGSGFIGGPMGLIEIGGLLYGASNYGGDGAGAIYSFNPTPPYQTTLLASLDYFTMGLGSVARLTAVGNDLFGTTTSGAQYGYGAIFKFNRTTNALSAIASFPTGGFFG